MPRPQHGVTEVRPRGAARARSAPPRATRRGAPRAAEATATTRGSRVSLEAPCAKLRSGGPAG
eukprot:197509-Alexandrium_andersonii.AAC.1